MSNRSKVLYPIIIVLTVVILAFFATPTFFPRETSSAEKGSQSMSSEDLMAYLQWKHIYLPNKSTRDSETQRILEYHRWKDTLEVHKARESMEKDRLMAYLQWKHKAFSDADQGLSDTERLMNYLQWKHNLPSTVAAPDETERLLKYLEWKHMQNPGE